MIRLLLFGQDKLSLYNHIENLPQNTIYFDYCNSQQLTHTLRVHFCLISKFSLEISIYSLLSFAQPMDFMGTYDVVTQKCFIQTREMCPFYNKLLCFCIRSMCMTLCVCGSLRYLTVFLHRAYNVHTMKIF